MLNLKFKKILTPCFLALAILANNYSYANQSGLDVLNPSIRATIASQPAQNSKFSTAAYLTITASKNCVLKNLSMPDMPDTNVQIHEMRMQNNVMRMRDIKELKLTANQSTALTGDYHLMLLNLKQPLKAGQNHNIKLNCYVDNSQEILSKIISFKVQGIKESMHSMHKHQH